MSAENPSSGNDSSPALPARTERLPVRVLDPPHPAMLSADRLLAQCVMRAQRRSGPGGQHRNKTSSGVFLHHRPTGLVGEATERRSQADNRAVALLRLRYQLAVAVRTPSILDQTARGCELEIRNRYLSTPLRINDRNDDKPAVLALLLNDLHASGGQPSAVAPLWQATTSSIVRVVKSHGPAWTLLGSIRSHHHRRPLK